MTIGALKLLASKWAQEEAEKSLAFSGDQALTKLGLPKEKQAEIRRALLLYCDTGAVQTVAALQRHGFLKDVT